VNQLEIIKQDYKNGAFYRGYPIEDLIKMVEAQQQEIEKLRKAVDEWKYDAECHMDEVNASKKENEQLQKCYDITNGSWKGLIHENERTKAQVSAMREALSEALSAITTGRLCSIGSLNSDYSAQISTSLVDKWIAALSSDVGLDYHNPTDAEALKKLTDDFAALKSLYDVENETFTEIVQKEKELLKEIDQKDTALERAARGVTSIIEQYTTDFTEEELLSDALCPREKVVLEYANETLEVLQEVLGGSEDGI
jgi:hypothetical protein